MEYMQAFVMGIPVAFVALRKVTNILDKIDVFISSLNRAVTALEVIASKIDTADYIKLKQVK